MSVMRPFELIEALVEATGESTLALAKAMHSKGFQPTLHKFIKGGVQSPKRESAERIAKYFQIPVDALYDTKLATAIARERGLLRHSSSSAPVPLAREQAASYVPRPAPIPEGTLARIAALTKEDRATLLTMIDRFLAGFETLEAQQRKAHSG